MPPKKEEKKKDMVVEVGFVVIVLLFILSLWSNILNYFLVDKYGSYSNIWQALKSWLGQYVYPVVVVLSLILTVLAVIGIFYNYKKLIDLNKEEKKKYGSTEKEEGEDERLQIKNGRWEHAIAHLNSPNSSEWRLAIIESDVILDEMLRAQGYHGDSIGEMLKGVEKSDMLTLDAAWEAHKVRNKIVHSGTEYDLTERDAKHVMGLYELVFREFKII